MAYEQYQNGPAESSINSIMLLNRTQMIESGLLGGFWFQALVTSNGSAKDERNVAYHYQIKTTPYYFMHGEPKNLSKFWAFGCREYPYLKTAEKEASTYFGLYRGESKIFSRKMRICHTYTIDEESNHNKSCPMKAASHTGSNH